MSYKTKWRRGLASLPMELLKESPAAFEGVARLFEMARQLPTTHRMDLKIGLAFQGSLFARGNLDGYRQVNFFAEHLRRQGWREHLLGGDDDLYGCDMLFSWPGETQDDSDPSFIRRPAMQLYG